MSTPSTHGLAPLDPERARQFIADAGSDFTWHQSFELAPGVRAPGVNDVDSLYAVAQVPEDLTGLTVLDIGTTNGGSAFEAERRGASRVVAVDVLDDTHFGFARIRELLGSRAEFVQASVYDLPGALGGEQFDLVFFWGVLYHLRHPILALDSVRAVARGRVMVETAIADHELAPEDRGRSLSRFYRGEELGGDPTNWFAPTCALLAEWCESSGLAVDRADAWPAEAPTRGHTQCHVTEGAPEAHGKALEGLVAGVPRPLPQWTM